MQRDSIVGMEHIGLDGDRGGARVARHARWIGMAGMGDEFGPQARDTRLGAHQRRMIEGDGEHLVESLGFSQQRRKPLDQRIGTLAFLDLDKRSETEPTGGGERLAKAWQPGSGKARVKPRTGVQTAEFVHRACRDAPPAVGRPVEDLVVDDDDLAVGV